MALQAQLWSANGLSVEFKLDRGAVPSASSKFLLLRQAAAAAFGDWQPMSQVAGEPENLLAVRGGVGLAIAEEQAAFLQEWPIPPTGGAGSCSCLQS